jgi:hypothetical protein
MTVTHDHTCKADQNTDRLKRLAAFAPIFRDPKTVFGEMIPPTGSGTPQDSLTFPWYKTSEVADSFIDMAYKSGWVLEGFDWGKWGHGPEGKKFYGNRKAIAAADQQQLAKLLTLLIRNDRFSEGSLGKAYEDKALLAIVERAEALISTTAGVSGKRKKASQVRARRRRS